MTTQTRLTHQEIAEHICRNQEFDGQTFREGAFVGLRDGRVVVVADTPEKVHDALTSLEPRSLRGMIFEVGNVVPDIIRQRARWSASIAFSFVNAKPPTVRYDPRN